MDGMEDIIGTRTESGLPFPRPPLPQSYRNQINSTVPIDKTMKRSSLESSHRMEEVDLPRLPSALTNHLGIDAEVDDLSNMMASSSLELVPKQVRRKKGKGVSPR
jgi:hypothetical protein